MGLYFYLESAEKNIQYIYYHNIRYLVYFYNMTAITNNILTTICVKDIINLAIII